MQGGVADFTAILGAALADQGARVHVLTAQDGGPPRVVGGVHVHPALRGYGWGSLYKAMRHTLAEISPDVINIQYQTAAYGMHPAINLLPRLYPSVPLVVTCHDLLVPYLFPKAGPVRWWANLALLRACKAAILTNQQDLGRVQGERLLSPLHLIPIGSNIADSRPTDYDRLAWRRRWGVVDETTLLCYFGFLNASKGGIELIGALDESRQAGRDVHLMMIGGAVGASDPTNRGYLDQVKRLIGERGLNEHITWTGHLTSEEVSASLCSADVCVLPYRDGVSFRRGSLMAALVHGLPIISTRPQVDIPEMVHGGNIWLVSPEDPDALAEAIARLADDDDLRMNLGDGARALSWRFDWREIARHTLEVYRDATGD
jgi:glycosyltransferase involved in cell wall biosynthesis